jgi:hypothetical protein
MVEFPFGCPAERKGLRRWLEAIPDTGVCGHYFFVIKPASDPSWYVGN